MAEYAWSYVLAPLFLQLCDPLRVCKELAGKACSVKLSFTYRLCRGIRIKPSCCDDRDVYEIPYVLDILQVAVFRHVDRWVGPVPCIVCPVVAVEHVIARILKHFHSFFRLRHIPSDFCVFLSRKSTFPEILCFGEYAVAQGYGEVRTASLLYRLDDFNCEAVSVLHRTAIFIRPLIHIFECELVQKISFMHRMDFNPVNTCIPEHQRAFGKRGDHLFYLIFCHLP